MALNITLDKVYIDKHAYKVRPVAFARHTETRENLIMFEPFDMIKSGLYNHAMPIDVWSGKDHEFQLMDPQPEAKAG